MLKRMGRRVSGKGLLNTAINKLPFELHLPGYNYCGPGTKLAQRLARGDKGINKLDEACKQHDIAYARNSDKVSRHIADLELANRAWERVKASDSSLKERAAALLVNNLMKAKVKIGAGTKGKMAAKRRNTRRTGRLMAAKKLINKSRQAKKRTIETPPKRGGILPLIPLFAGLSALGSIAGGSAAIANAVNTAKKNKKALQESERHNQTMEAIAQGKKGSGMLVYPLLRKLTVYGAKQLDKILSKKFGGKGLYLRPYPKGAGLKTKCIKLKKSPNQYRYS